MPGVAIGDSCNRIKGGVRRNIVALHYLITSFGIVNDETFDSGLCHGLHQPSTAYIPGHSGDNAENGAECRPQSQICSSILRSADGKEREVRGSPAVFVHLALMVLEVN